MARGVAVGRSSRSVTSSRYGADLTPTEVARKHGISSGQLYTWRHEVVGVRAAVLTRAAPRFTAVEVAAAPPTTEPAIPAPDMADMLLDNVAVAPAAQGLGIGGNCWSLQKTPRAKRDLIISNSIPTKP